MLYAYGDVVGGLPDQLTPVQQDWLDILGAIYAADLVCARRPGDVGWARTIEMWMPVRVPEHWQPLADRFRRIFGALTYDEFAIYFVAGEPPARRPRQGREFLAADCVALLSGGIDSFAGAAHLLNEGRTPLLVSHQNSGSVARALQAVDDGLKRIGSSAGHHTFTAHLEGLDSESTQRSRSMLYMGIACLLAVCMELQDVYLNENGIMAINAPLTEARVGSNSTHTASPTIVRDLAQLASVALGRQVAIRNVLITDTKPEVVQRIERLELADVLPRTVSCWAIGRTGQHCGYCIPCIVRLVSCEFAEVPDVEYKTQPLDAIPANASWRDTATDNVVHLCAHVSELADADDYDLELQFTDLLNCGDQLTRQESFAMHRRWAQQCLRILSRHPAAAAFLGY